MLAKTMRLHYHTIKIDFNQVATDVNLLLTAESTLTDRYQTTIPEAVRKSLGLGKRDRLCYTIESDGRVVISRIEPEQSDPVLEKFLTFLERDIELNPHQISAIDADLVARARSLVQDVNLDLDAPLADEDE
jgi:antitoxin PrlF